MKKKIISLMIAVLAAGAFVSCSDWTEPEARDFTQHKPASYYENLRAWKADKSHPIAFGWFGGWAIIVADVIVGTTDEPWVRVHDFDGRTLIVSRGNVVDHIPEETFLVIDLGCSSCTETFTAEATSAALSGPDSTWSGPADFTELSLR